MLGIDTSNYTTSLAVTDRNESILFDSRKALTVRRGERGLRQSYALFQHMENIPEMLPELFGRIDKSRIGAVAASGRPRPVEGSYMPVFKAGVNYGKVMAAAFGAPFFEFSHQEGHLEAAGYGSGLSEAEDCLAYHLSGGTCELLHVKPAAEGPEGSGAPIPGGRSIRILGGSRDLSFGQVLDRIGVALGMDFPAGREMDLIAVRMRDKFADEAADLKPDNAGKAAGIGRKAGKTPGNNPRKPGIALLTEIPIDGLAINLSGIETQCRRELEKGSDSEALVLELFRQISRCLCRLTEKAAAETGCSRVLFAGGVSASRFVREELVRYFAAEPVNPGKKPGTNPEAEPGIKPQLIFCDPALASDNAAGVALLGGKALWRSNR